jgi:hypothetical protein
MFSGPTFMTVRSAALCRTITVDRVMASVPSLVRTSMSMISPDMCRPGEPGARSGHGCPSSVNFALHKYSTTCAGCKQRLVYSRCLSGRHDLHKQLK